MYQGIKISGFGGQGVVSAGALLANAGMLDGLNVSLFPAYGAEMRGGTANCSVVMSSDEVASPIVTVPDTVIVMNEPSLARWEKDMKPGGLMIINSSLVNSKPTRKDIKAVYVPCNQIAQELGSLKIANAVVLGAYAKQTKAVSPESLIKALPKVYKKAKPEVLELNAQAIKKGFAIN
ncbi:MAG TPA: 2-oxoacid:acceptor oxidoreductase family protein [Elusimicrobiales bacterium]|nr:2-oxoacid:acceptor oxidoreductase family protein [Elusimicrobiales bacterium]